MFDVKIIKDSISPENIRLITFQMKYPRYIHAELMTHRVFSRSASSSRAVPVNKLADLALEEMVKPIRWGLNQPGMQANEQNLEGKALEEANKVWEEAAVFCANSSKRLAELGLHKQWANRLTEWFGNINVVVSSTEWTNWDELRAHPDAQPEIKHLAELMIEARRKSIPTLINHSEWHLPYVTDEEKQDPFFKIEANRFMLPKISTARCARVSYLKHDGTSPNIDDDLALYQRLVGFRPQHMSPTEHIAYPDVLVDGKWKDQTKHGNFRGWSQFRKLIEL